MIIIEGPDHTGKTTLAKAINELSPELTYYHFTQHSGYSDYIEDLSSLKHLTGILDRHAISEVPYSHVMKRDFRFTQKQFHNLVLMTLAQNPLFILGTHEPPAEDYSPDQYMPISEWGLCMTKYLEFLHSENIEYLRYDYTKVGDLYPKFLANLHKSHLDSIEWVKPLWEKGMGYTGSPHPVILLVAERIGPSNSHCLPFEEGPTGYMLSEVIHDTHTPLGSIAITNLVKLDKYVDRASKEYKRPVNEDDLNLFELELQHLQPRKVLFMGKVSKDAGTHICDINFTPCDSIIHLGALNHQGIKDLTNYKIAWWDKIKRDLADDLERRRKEEFGEELTQSDKYGSLVPGKSNTHNVPDIAPFARRKML